MTTPPIEKVIAALQRERFSLTPAEIHRAVDRALRPEEPKARGTIVILYDGPYRVDGLELMNATQVMLQYAPGSPMDTEENGNARWYDGYSEAYRTWEWVCERDGEKRVFVPADSLGDGCCAVDGPCRNGCEPEGSDDCTGAHYCMAHPLENGDHAITGSSTETRTMPGEEATS